MIGLGIWDLGFRHMTNSRRPITKPEDVQGLKLRVIASPIYIEPFKALGANPVPMTFGEVYAALETQGHRRPGQPRGRDRVREVRRGAEVPVSDAALLHRHAVADEQEDLGFACHRRSQTFIREAADEAKAEERKVLQAQEAESIERLRKAMQVNELAPAEVERMREKVQPVSDKFVGEVGEPLPGKSTANSRASAAPGRGDRCRSSGTAAVAMWWDMAPALRSEFEDWHSHEHFPERMSIPGFRRGSRWASDDGEGFFVLYELEDYET